MAKIECKLQGDFRGILNDIDQTILEGSVSATLEDSSDFTLDGTLCSVRVYERYSAIGSNRVSLSVTLYGADEGIYLSAITSGGSQALFFKMNTIGEESFLECIHPIIDRYRVL